MSWPVVFLLFVLLFYFWLLFNVIILVQLKSIVEECTYVTNLIQHLLLVIPTLWNLGSYVKDSYKVELDKDSHILECEILFIFFLLIEYAPTEYG